jgi:hypothetical protein
MGLGWPNSRVKPLARLCRAIPVWGTKIAMAKPSKLDWNFTIPENLDRLWPDRRFPSGVVGRINGANKCINREFLTFPDGSWKH